MPLKQFKHKPLDHHRPSIRLIKVLPTRSPGGLLQCQIFHSSTSARYTCLSYVWGKEHDHYGPFDILLNGKLFAVRYNLYAFLNVARTRFPESVFWIDALVIDQKETSERNHQVQQMGQIYSKAEMVVAWLGDEPAVERALASLRIAAARKYCFSGTGFNIAKRVRALTTQHGASDYENYKRLCTLAEQARSEDHENFVAALEQYWSCAWITQELALAPRVKLLAREIEWYLSGTSRTGFNRARTRLDHPDSSKEGSAFHEVRSMATQRYEGGNKSLLALLGYFRSKECSVQRDRIFSLLSLCDEGSNIEVDYGISEARLLCRVLMASKNTLCLCSAAVTVQALDLTAPLRNNLSDKPLLREDFAEFNICSVHIGRPSAQEYPTPVNCSSCSSELHSSWYQPQSIMFCLNSVCRDLSGHLLWEQPVSSKEEALAAHPGRVYYASPSILERRLAGKCFGQMGEQVKIALSEDGRIYIIRVTLSALLKVFSEQTRRPSLCDLSYRSHGYKLLIPDDEGGP